MDDCKNSLIGLENPLAASSGLDESGLGLGMLAAIMDANPVPCFVIDRQHRVVFWNRGCEEVVGYPGSKMIGTRDHWQAFYDSPRPTLADLIVDNLAAGLGDDMYRSNKFRPSTIITGAFEAESFFPNIGSGGCWLFFTAAPIRNERGEIIGAVETLQDVTSQRRAEMQLQEAKLALERRVAERTAELAESNRQLAASLDRAEEVNRLKTAFLATISHELKTPLNGIIGLSDLIVMEHKDDDAGEYARLINDCGKNLFLLLTNLLALTELEAGEAEISINPCDPHDLLEGLMKEFLAPAAEKNIALLATFQPETQPVINTDPQRVRNCLAALLDNSIRYMDRIDGGRIEISCQVSERELRIAVSDNGPGIAAEFALKVFEKFHQLEGYETRRHEGMGIGLALARAQAESLGGSLRLDEKQDGAGARFVLQIPLSGL